MSASQVLPFLTGVGGQAIATFASPVEGASGGEAREGSLAKQLKPLNASAAGWKTGQINVVKDYDWTLSNIKNKNDIPYIRLLEFYNTETAIKKQLDFYTKGVGLDTLSNAFRGTGGAVNAPVLDPYKEIFSKDKPTDFAYWLPYFNKTAFELGTPSWQALDKIGESLKSIVTGGGALLGMEKQAQTLTKGMDFLTGASSTALAWQYAGVGTFDRPRIFAGHNERTITISFPLFNTKSADAWIQNKDFIYLLMSQNLYNKRDYVTGIPPVFYEVYVPGQYFCWAASMSNISVENLGNTRVIYDNIVPDAYQVNLTLTEMTMPSKNQFEAITSGEAAKFVDSSVVTTAAAEEGRRLAQGRLTNLATQIADLESRTREAYGSRAFPSLNRSLTELKAEQASLQGQYNTMQ